jgi:nucleoside-diphosphate-sugar epimerase
LIHAADLVEALLLAADKGSRIDPATAAEEGYRQGCYFAADDQAVTYGQLGSLIVRSLGGRFVLNLPMPQWSVWMSAFVNDRISRLRGEAYIFNIDKAREAPAGSWTCSSEKIRTELDFQTGAPLSERVQETGQWYREQRLL